MDVNNIYEGVNHVRFEWLKWRVTIIMTFIWLNAEAYRLSSTTFFTSLIRVVALRNVYTFFYKRFKVSFVSFCVLLLKLKAKAIIIKFGITRSSDYDNFYTTRKYLNEIHQFLPKYLP